MIKRSLRIVISAVLSAVFMLTCYAEPERSSASPAKVYSLTTSQNENYCAKITIEKQLIRVSGCFKGSQVKKIHLYYADDISTTLKAEADGSFTAVINPGKPKKTYDYLTIEFKDTAPLRYRMQYNNGWYFPDNNMSGKNSSVTEKADKTNIKACVQYLTDNVTRDNIEDTLEKAKQLSDEITKGISDPYEKVIAISDWVSKNIYYDNDAKTNSVTASTICVRNVLKTKRTVCGGFANVFAVLAEAQGIPCVCVKGNAVCSELPYEKLTNNGYNHEWNAVFINDRWITVDTCWNSYNDYINGEFQKNSPVRKYFDPSPLAFSLTHAAYKAEYRNFFSAMQYFETTAETTSLAPSSAESSTPVPDTETSAALTTPGTEASQISANDSEGESSSANSLYADSFDGDGTNTLLFIAALLVILALITALVTVLILQRKQNRQ